MDKKTENAIVELLTDIRAEVIKTNKKLDHQTEVMNKGFKELQDKFDEAVIQSHKRMNAFDIRVQRIEDKAA